MSFKGRFSERRDAHNRLSTLRHSGKLPLGFDFLAAKKMGRSERLMRYWCIRGRWASLNIPTYKDASGRWWIHISDED